MVPGSRSSLAAPAPRWLALVAFVVAAVVIRPANETDHSVRQESDRRAGQPALPELAVRH
jgi:hypothetical protein